MAQSKNYKVFVVEDSAVIRDNLVAALEELAPVKVVGTAEDERSAMDWLGLNAGHCDLVVIDVFLKEGSGLGVLRTAAELYKSAKLVVLTNFATPDLYCNCLELGANRVFDKSNEIEALILYCHRLAVHPTGGGTFH